MKKAVFLVLFGLLPQSVLLSHPFYVSVTELHFYADRLELSARLFTDDFETALRAEPLGKKVDLIKKQPAQIDSLVARYVRQNLFVSLDGERISPKYVGYEIEEDATWAHFEYPLHQLPRKVRVENHLLLQYFPNQQNITHIEKGSYRRTRRLSSSERVMDVTDLPKN